MHCDKPNDLISSFFQKGSPYLDDVNYLIGLQNQMGDSMESQIQRALPNMTKCLTWNDVKKSHLEQDQNVVITFEDIGGLLLVLAVGLIAAIMISSLELLVAATKRKSKTILPLVRDLKKFILCLYPEEK